MFLGLFFFKKILIYIFETFISIYVRNLTLIEVHALENLFGNNCSGWYVSDIELTEVIDKH